ncbi:MAG: radical SAM protein [Spirochaetia bacterium]
MELSRHTIYSKMRDGNDYFLVNILTGSADIVSAPDMEAIRAGTYKNIHELEEKGYLIAPEAEESLVRRAYLDFLDKRDAEELQLFFAPWYTCNFNCSYCYQREYHRSAGLPEPELIDAFFTYVEKEFGARKKYITLFGGEPLLPGKAHRSVIEYFINRASKAGIPLAVVTNGYHLQEYLPLLAAAEIREIQVTLDGPEAEHNRRRSLPSGRDTFRRIVAGIDAALKRGIPLNLRVVIDRENMPALKDLARFAVAKGWTADPLFKTQLGRNYELHTCGAQEHKLYTRLSLYEDLYDRIKQWPEIAEFHKPAFSISRFLFENGELPQPLFDSCPGTKSEWAFDFSGSIYACTATVGKKGEELGSFYPEIIHNTQKIEEWQERDIMGMEQCRTCSVSLACGGGCGAVAKNRAGAVGNPDCRPIRELLEMGISYYAKGSKT